jgi:site-specific recombinase
LSRTGTSAWDLTALVNAADPRAAVAERHLWLARLMEWLRHAPASVASQAAPLPDEPRTPRPLLKLRHLLNLLDAHPEIRARVRGMLAKLWDDVDAAALFADFGFGTRRSLAGELLRRLGLKLLPGTPETTNGAELFQLLFEPADAAWVDALDDALLERVAALLAPEPAAAWRATLLDAITILVSEVHAGGFEPALRERMDRALLAREPFRQLAPAAEALRNAVQAGHADDTRRAALYLRTLLDACRDTSASVRGHLEEFGVSVDIVFGVDQLHGRVARTEALLDTLLSPAPLPDLKRLVVSLLHVAAAQREFGPLLARQYSLLARQVAERNAETGSHYITTDRAGWRDMLGRAAGGGAVIAGTTFAKFAIAALGLGVFWTGFWSGVNYAASFVLIMLLHWTVATKQPAMTAPAMAAALAEGTDDAQVEAFVDRVAALIRSQAAAIFGNLMVCGPLVLGFQLGAQAAFGAPLVGPQEAGHVLHTLTLLGPTLLYAAFTGVLLFSSSLIAGWAENFFVYHRLDSAIAWHPRSLALLGAARARRWSRWWRANVSGLAANVSLGLMLGLVPALAGFFALPLEVRHVTLSTGQLAAAAGAIGWPVLHDAAFWWCLAAIVGTGLLNVGVSFWLAFKVALRSRGVRVKDRQRIGAALRRRLRQAPLSFVLPPRG